ncbi:hypothetical protein ACHAWF_006919 [Thalassiosira exigua]
MGKGSYVGGIGEECYHSDHKLSISSTAKANLKERANSKMYLSIEEITQVNDNDVICGRKGVALKHPGNLAYRNIVGMNKELYATCARNEKLRISKSIVAAMREVGGRFLEREDGGTSTSLDETDKDGNPVVWRDIGDKRAVEKTSQALREGQSKLLKKLAKKNREPYVVVAPPQTQHFQPTPMNCAAENSFLSPFCQSVTPPLPPPPSVLPTPPPSVLPALISQLDSSDKDRLLLALLSRPNGQKAMNDSNFISHK